MPGLPLAAVLSAILPIPPADRGVQSMPASAFPEIEISRASVPHEWPFTVEAGTLSCVSMGAQRVVIFAEPWRTDRPQEFGNMSLPRSVIVSANPIAIFASYEDRALYAPFDRLETLIRRLGPFEAMGMALCEAGAAVPPDGEAAP